MARRRLPRETRRNMWRNRLEWMAFCGCLVGGVAAIWLFVSFTG
jgi:hypothetical protein